MKNLIVQLIKYGMILIISFYSYYSFFSYRLKDQRKEEILHFKMTSLVVILHFLGHFALYLQTYNKDIIGIYIVEVIFLIFIYNVYKWIYPNISKSLINNTIMLTSIGFIMQLRLSTDNIKRHIFMVIISFVLALIIPVLIETQGWISKLGYVYGLLAIAILLVVLFFGETKHGATNWLEIRGHIFQPSEFVKIIFVFSIAALLSAKTEFKRILMTSLIAGICVLILVLEKDLGGALIFFITYIFMLYIASNKSFYLFTGLISASIASVVAYKIFNHVRVRVMAWQNPIKLIDNEGYQVSQSLFAIGTGGWFGMGIKKGMPHTIPVVESDFIFSAISEEFGALFAISLILIFINTFLMMAIVSFKIKNKFYKLLSLGFSVLITFQVFLSIAGVIKFIPSTGVTLPLISYGGSSIISSIMIFMILQGIYIKTYETKDKEDKEKDQNKIYEKSIFRMIYIFLGLFILMTGYLFNFLIFKKDEFINNTYNKRTVILEERVIRGKIITSDGKVVASTSINEDGSQKRNYPYDNMFAHAVGKTSKGMTGIEEAENIRLLTSRVNDIDSLYNELTGKKNEGNNVITTLNYELQNIAYKALGDNKGAVVVLEAKTGKILAMVSKPDFNPNNIDKQWDSIKDNHENSALINRATQGKYPPGSTYKILTAIEYIRNNPSYLEYKYNCTGSITKNNMTIHCYNNKKHGQIDLKQAIAKSCNTFFAEISSKIDLDSFLKLNEDFYFNKPLQLNMVSNPSVYDLKKASASDEELMQTLIGQGKTLITPIHNAMIIGSIANDGLMMNPYIIDKVEDSSGRIIKENKPKELSRPITRIEAAIINSMLAKVIEDGTGSQLKDLNVKVAGKTGSAEQENKKAHAWFVGFAPYEDAEILVSVIVENKGSGSTHAVPIAKKIFKYYFLDK